MYQHASAAPDIFFQSVSCLISSSVAIPRSEASCSCEAFKFAQCAIAVFRTLAAVHNFMRFGAKKFAALHEGGAFADGAEVHTIFGIGQGAVGRRAGDGVLQLH